MIFLRAEELLLKGVSWPSETPFCFEVISLLLLEFMFKLKKGRKVEKVKWKKKKKKKGKEYSVILLA